MAGLFDKRIILVSGKGGVGRSTVAAALASHLAQRDCQKIAKRNLRVLVCEVGQHGEEGSVLANYFGQNQWSNQPRVIRKRLDGGELRATEGHRLFVEDHIPAGIFAGLALRSSALRRFLESAPSLEEMGWFYHLLHLLEKKNTDGTLYYSHIIVDMPATGHAAALVALPDTLLELITGGPIPKVLKRGQAILLDEKQCAVLVVTLPEVLPLTEAQEHIDDLHKSRLHVTGVVINRSPGGRLTEDDVAKLQVAIDDLPAQTQNEPYIFGTSLLAAQRAQEESSHAFLQAGLFVEQIPYYSKRQSAQVVERVAEEISKWNDI